MGYCCSTIHGDLAGHQQEVARGVAHGHRILLLQVRPAYCDRRDGRRAGCELPQVRSAAYRTADTAGPVKTNSTRLYSTGDQQADRSKAQSEDWFYRWHKCSFVVVLSNRCLIEFR